MATLVLGTVGRAVGGRIGGAVGTVLGSALDRRILGGGKPRDGARLSDLSIQSSAYGEPIARLYGRMRVAGTLVWSPGIRETRGRAGGGKRGTATSSYSYSASFAVVVAARPIQRIERIWADGKLMRDAAGGLIYPATIRVHAGHEDQEADALIVAAEGIDRAPAYRGRAYVVFEDLPLADYGNRIPNLTFEVVADAGDDVGLGTIVTDIADVSGVAVGIAGVEPRVHGFAATAPSARETLGEIDPIAGLSIASGPGSLRLRFGAAATSVVIANDDLGATNAGTVAGQTDTRAASTAMPDMLTLGHSDPARDYQSGTQRAVRQTPALRHTIVQFNGSLTAPAARQAAETLLRRAIASRTIAAIALPWRYAGLSVGDVVAVGAGDAWRIVAKAIVGLVVELDLGRVATDAAPVAAVDPGRVDSPDDRPPGPITLHVLDLPPLAGAVPTVPRLLIAAAAAGRFAGGDIVMSFDGGDSYLPVTSISQSSVVGAAQSMLAPGCTDRWDRRNMLDVDLLDATMWLESKSEAAILGGANLALVGDEIIQFATATALAPGRFRLSTLLRGRRGTETALEHALGDRFVMLDDPALAVVDLPSDAVGAIVLVKAIGPSEDVPGAAAVEHRVRARSLRPPAPVFLRCRLIGDGGLTVSWIRRSRAGFAWIDGADAPIGEDGERYAVTAMIDGIVARQTAVIAADWAYSSEMIASDGGRTGSAITITVAQLGAVGPGEPATQSLTLP